MSKPEGVKLEGEVLASFSTRELAEEAVERGDPEAASNEAEAAVYRVTLEAIVEREAPKPRERPLVAVFYFLVWLVVLVALLGIGCPR